MPLVFCRAYTLNLSVKEYAELAIILVLTLCKRDYCKLFGYVAAIDMLVWGGGCFEA